MKIRNLCSEEKKLFARKLRLNQTPAEKMLWAAIRKRTLGVKFRRQSLIFGWIVDFYCPELHLIVEVDGSQHDPVNDRKRDRILFGKGFTTLRFQNRQIFDGLNDVISSLSQKISSLI